MKKFYLIFFFFLQNSLVFAEFTPDEKAEIQRVISENKMSYFKLVASSTHSERSLALIASSIIKSIRGDSKYTDIELAEVIDWIGPLDQSELPLFKKANESQLFGSLPLDVHLKILKMLNRADHLRFALVCRRTNEILSNIYSDQARVSDLFRSKLDTDPNYANNFFISRNQVLDALQDLRRLDSELDDNTWFRVLSKSYSKVGTFLSLRSTTKAWIDQLRYGKTASRKLAAGYMLLRLRHYSRKTFDEIRQAFIDVVNDPNPWVAALAKHWDSTEDLTALRVEFLNSDDWNLWLIALENTTIQLKDPVLEILFRQLREGSDEKKEKIAALFESQARFLFWDLNKSRPIMGNETQISFLRALIHAVNDPNPRVRLYVVKGLCSLSLTRNYSEYYRVRSVPDQSHPLRSIPGVFTEALKDSDTEVRSAAIQGLKDYGLSYSSLE